jgi:hypothetical protein
LGAEGIVWELRGSVDGPLAMGPIEVLVDESSLPDARELLLVDDLEDSFAPAMAVRQRTRRDTFVLVAVIVLVTLFAIARMAARV